MSRDHSQNHYGPNASFDGYDSDLASAGILIESLRQQLASLKDEMKAISYALDDPRTDLTLSMVEVIHLHKQQLAAANGLIAEQNKLGKERQEWALHTSEVIRSLNQQLAAALAVCKLKDEALSKIEYLESDNGSILSAGGCSSVATEALAIQPDDSALNVWIGEPVAIMGSHGHPKHISYIPGIQEEKLYGPWIPLYAPKGMK